MMVQTPSITFCCVFPLMMFFMLSHCPITLSKLGLQHVPLFKVCVSFLGLLSQSTTKLGGFRKQKQILLTILELAVQNQGVNSASGGSEGAPAPCPSLCLWWLPAIFCIPWLMAAVLQSLTPSLESLLPFVPLSESPSLFFSKDISHWI